MDTLDYHEVPWEKRPLAMRQMEKMLNEPMERILAAAWFKYRSIPKVRKALNLEDTTTRRWMRKLGLFICIGCSKKTGTLFMHTSKCLGCRRWFCDECMEKKEFEHWIPKQAQ